MPSRRTGRPPLSSISFAIRSLDFRYNLDARPLTHVNDTIAVLPQAPAKRYLRLDVTRCRSPARRRHIMGVKLFICGKHFFRWRKIGNDRGSWRSGQPKENLVPPATIHWRGGSGNHARIYRTSSAAAPRADGSQPLAHDRRFTGILDRLVHNSCPNRRIYGVAWRKTARPATFALQSGQRAGCRVTLPISNHMRPPCCSIPPTRRPRISTSC